MSLRYIIDGYNVIHHPKFSLPKAAPDSRTALLDFILIHKLAGSAKNRITVVFDGYPGATRIKDGLAENIEIIFSRKESADQAIKSILENSAGSKNIFVVSDDKEIKIFTRLTGARSLSVEDFICRKDKTHRPQDKALKPELTYSQMHKINQELRKIWLG